MIPMLFLYTELKHRIVKEKSVLHRLLPICSSSNTEDKPKPVPGKRNQNPKLERIPIMDQLLTADLVKKMLMNQSVILIMIL